MLYEDLIKQIMKPGRYIGREWNVSKKPFEGADIKLAICFPDLYEVGMSNLGLRILYGILNDIDGVTCERFFSPAADLEELLRREQLEIFSLESQKRLSEFDFIGFSLGYELSYTNVLNILDLGKTPLESSLRDHTYPLVIGGGPCVMNPEPMHEFFDLFFFGEAEEAIPEIVSLYREFREKYKSGQISKPELLVMFSHIEGVYVPSLYEIDYDPEGKIRRFEPKSSAVPARVRKRFVENLDTSFYPVDWLVPYIAIIHDRITLEIMRGCPNRCRFCQARTQYFPFRRKSSGNVLNLACQAYKATGYEELALAGLSVSEYPYIEELLASLLGIFKEKAVGISLPSIKPRKVVGSLSALISLVRKTGLTFAPEAATERLRRVINKNFNLEDFFDVIEQSYFSGYQHIKLYFMIGLPFEAESDLDGIVELATRISDLRKKTKRPPAQVNISVNTLIPKPHTPFQWLAMPVPQDIKAKHDYLRGRVKNKKLKLALHDPHMSILEGVFSRGDRRLSGVIKSAFKRGARFDSWQNQFNFERWLAAFADNDIDYGFYLRERLRDEILPWDCLDAGVTKSELLGELDLALSAGKGQS